MPGYHENITKVDYTLTAPSQRGADFAAFVPKYTGLLKGLEYMWFLFFVLFIVRYHLRSTFSTR